MRTTLVASGLAVLCLFAASCGEKGTASTGPGSNTTEEPKIVFADDAFKHIRLEAEDAVHIEGVVMRVVEDPEASGGKCVWIPDKAGTPDPKSTSPKYDRAVYKFKVEEPGYYTFWCRRKWKDSCGDTLAVRFDKVGRPHSEAFDFGHDDSSWRWGWSPVYEGGKPRQFFLEAGNHTLEILNREDGPRYDVILLTNDRDYVPQGLEAR